MKILCVNAGSSSLKFQMYEMPEEKILIKGRFERIGIDNSFYVNNKKYVMRDGLAHFIEHLVL